MSPLEAAAGTLPLGAVDVDGGRIDALRRSPPGAAGARRAAAGELQVMFLTQLMQAMRRTIPKSDLLPESPARSVYEGTFDRAVAGAMAARDPLGLVRTLGEGPDLKITNHRADTVRGDQAQGRGRARP